MSVKRYEGLTCKYWSERQYGFLEYTTSGRTSTIFFLRKDLACDWKGSRAHLFAPGIPATFEITRHPSKKDPLAVRATNIRPVFTEEAGGDLSNYWEVSRLLNDFGERRFSFLRRPCGDDLYVGLSAIDPRFEDRIPFLRPGDFIVHRVEKKEEGFWRACNVELYALEEQKILQESGIGPHVLLPQPQVQPMEAPEPEPVVSVCTPETAGKQFSN